MAKTAAERQSERRRRLKENEEEYKKYKDKDTLRKLGKHRETQKTRSEMKARLFREKERLRKQKYREKLKNVVELVENKPDKPGFKTPQSKGKAVRRVLRSLPRSPSKAFVVVKELINTCKVTLSPKKQSNPISGMENEVQQFYQRDDVSRQSPGRKDVITVRHGNVKTKCQKRYMYTTIAEAYQIFKKEHPDIKIGKSKFFTFRPKFVLPLSEMPHHNCLCRYHENFQLLLRALSGYCREFPKKSSDLISLVVCSDENEKCMTSKCELCGVQGVIQKYNELTDDTTELTWYTWKYVEGKIAKIVKEDTVSEAFKELISKIPQFINHCFLVKIQSSYFLEKKNNVDEESIVLQIDVAENYSVRQQDEIQSAYWGSQQVTIFTAVAWISPTVLQSYAIISDELSHDKYAVNAFLKHLLITVKTKFPNVKVIDIFSDGAASQFKQRYTLCNITLIQEELQLTLTWNFLATSHGKGSVDGIGGELKRLVWHAVLSGKFNVTDAKSFYECAQKVSKSTIVILYTKEEVEIQKRGFDEAMEHIHAIPDTQSVHKVKAVLPYTVSYSKYSRSSVETQFHFLEGKCQINNPLEKKNTVQLGCFVMVNFAAKRGFKQFIGQIVTIDGDEYEIMFMRKNITDLKFSFKNNDTSWISQSDIVKVLSTPNIDSRQRYFFPGLDVTAVS